MRLFEANNSQQSAGCDRCRSSPRLLKEHLHRQHPPRRRQRSRSSLIGSTAIICSAALLSLMMWRVQGFATNPPKQRALVAPLSNPLAAINSRELRFYNGGKKLPKGNNKHHQIPSFGSSSLPEVLVASMNNYFFASSTSTLIGLTQESEEATATKAHRVTTSSDKNGVLTTRTTIVRSTSSSIRTKQAPSSTTLLAPVPRSLLLSQQSFRASSSGSSAPPDSDDDITLNWNTLRDRLHGNVVNGGQQPPDDNTSPLQESTEGKIYRAPAAAFDKSNQSPPSFAKTTKQYPPPRQGYGYSIQLTEEEKSLFRLLRQVHEETQLTTTLRVAGGWVRDKLLATPEFQIFHHYNYSGGRLTSKFKSPSPSLGRQGTKVLGQVQDEQNGPVDIDVALDTMLGREFADHLNAYLQDHGKDTVSVGVVLKNPEKSKHLETATMKVGTFWIDFVNLRAEEYAEDSRIPDLMRIGTAKEDAFRRDLTINSLFFNINTGQVEDWTGRGFADLRRGVVATPLAPLTTLLDDPLRVLRSIRFAARLRFTMDKDLVTAAKDDRVRMALAQKVSRERVGGEVDLMLRSPDPVGAMRLLINLNLVGTVFPVASCLPKGLPVVGQDESASRPLFDQCLNLLSTTHDHLFDCKVSPPIWCQAKRLLTTHNVAETTLTNDEEARRLLWYAAFLKPIHDYSERVKQRQEPGVSKRAGRKANRSIMSKLLVDELKRPGRDADAVEKIMKAANDITHLIRSGCDVSATLILLSEVRVRDNHGILMPTMRGRLIDSVTEEDPVWEHAMEFRLLCSRVLRRVGGLWRASLLLSLSEQLASLNDGELDYAIEGDVIDESKEERRQGIIEQYDGFAAALQQIGLIGIWGATPLIDGQEMKEVLPYIPRGPAFRDVMDEQERWITTHPGATKEPLTDHLKQTFAEFTIPPKGGKGSGKKSKKNKATNSKDVEMPKSQAAGKKEAERPKANAADKK